MLPESPKGIVHCGGFHHHPPSSFPHSALLRDTKIEMYLTLWTPVLALQQGLALLFS